MAPTVPQRLRLFENPREAAESDPRGTPGYAPGKPPAIPPRGVRRRGGSFEVPANTLRIRSDVGRTRSASAVGRLGPRAIANSAGARIAQTARVAVTRRVMAGPCAGVVGGGVSRGRPPPPRPPGAL